MSFTGSFRGDAIIWWDLSEELTIPAQGVEWESKEDMCDDDRLMMISWIKMRVTNLRKDLEGVCLKTARRLLLRRCYLMGKKMATDNGSPNYKKYAKEIKIITSMQLRNDHFRCMNLNNWLDTKKDLERMKGMIDLHNRILEKSKEKKMSSQDITTRVLYLIM